MKKWMLVAGAVVLVTIAVLAPAVFAQGPADGYGPGYGRGAMVNGGQFGPGALGLALFGNAAGAQALAA